MAGSGGAEIDRVLEIVVAEINSLAEPQGGGPPVTLTLGGSVVSRNDHSGLAMVRRGRACGRCGVHGAYGWLHRRRARRLGEAVSRRQRVPGPGPRGAPRRAERGRRSVRALPPPARPGRPHQLHPPEQCPGARPRRRPSATGGDALAGTTVRGLRVVLRAPRMRPPSAGDGLRAGSREPGRRCRCRPCRGRDRNPLARRLVAHFHRWRHLVSQLCSTSSSSGGLHACSEQRSAPVGSMSGLPLPER